MKVLSHDTLRVPARNLASNLAYDPGRGRVRNTVRDTVRRIARDTVLLGCVVLLVACGGSPKRGNQTLDGDSAIVKPVTIDGVQDGLAIDPNSVAGRAPQERVIYFDYNQAELRPEFLDIVAQHGRFLAQNPTGRLRLEGHTDERGSREYNIGLGEARAKTIARMLQLQGVSSAQTRTVSYGEELPVDEGHNNEAWAKNRRVNLIYENEVPN